jgi:hypothetical protein
MLISSTSPTYTCTFASRSRQDGTARRQRYTHSKIWTDGARLLDSQEHPSGHTRAGRHHHVTYGRHLYAQYLARSLRLPRGLQCQSRFSFPVFPTNSAPIAISFALTSTRHNVEVKVQEDFKDYGGVTLEKLDIYISACDAVIHLVGDMTGAAAKPASTQAIVAKYPDLVERLPPLREPLEQALAISYTQWEAWLAIYHGEVLLVAQAGQAPRGPNFAPTEASRAAQQGHLDRLRAAERYPGCTFASGDQLAKWALSSTILDLLAKDHGERDDPLPPFVNITGLPETGYERLVGREAELKRLDDAWADRNTNILSLVAEGGAGKSSPRLAGFTHPPAQFRS